MLINLLETAFVKALTILTILLEAASVVMNGFLKDGISHTNRFLKAAGRIILYSILNSFQTAVLVLYCDSPFDQHDVSSIITRSFGKIRQIGRPKL